MQYLAYLGIIISLWVVCTALGYGTQSSNPSFWQATKDGAKFAFAITIITSFILFIVWSWMQILRPLVE